MAGEACVDIKLIGKVTVRQKLQVFSLYTLTHKNAIYTYICNQSLSGHNVKTDFIGLANDFPCTDG